MADVYSAIILDDDYWDGTESWAGEVSEANRDSKYSTRRFTTVPGWEADRDGNSSGGNDEYGIIIGPWASAETNGLDIAGWNADAVILECPLTLPDGTNDARHNGIYGGNAYRIEYGSGEIDVDQNYTSIIGIQVGHTQSANTKYAIDLNTGNYGQIKDCIVKGVLSDTAKCYGIYFRSGADDDIVIANNIVYGFDINDSRGISISSSGVSGVECYNNTVSDCAFGIYRSSSGTGATVKNNAVFNCGDDYRGTTDKLAYQASDDGDGANEVDWDAGATDWAKNFNDYASGDFTIGSEGAGADIVDAGIGPDSDGDVPATDIIGNARSGNTCTIGAFEYYVAPSGWTGKIKGVTDPSKILGVAVADISKVCGVE